MRKVAFGAFVVVLALVSHSVHAADAIPHAVKVARATVIPACTVFVDAAAKGGDGTAQAPHETIAAAVTAAQSGAVICVAEGTYAERIEPADKFFTLAGGFQRGSGFKVRDSAKYVSKAQGNGGSNGGSFLHIFDPGPKDGLTAIDGFEITGFSQAILRDYYEPQRFDITNNYIHDNTCAKEDMYGAGFALNNVSGTIRGNVLRKNSCGRGGAGFLNDEINTNTIKFESNLVEGNSGTEPGASHGGALFFGVNALIVTNNEIVNNTVTQWGGGLYVGAYTQGNQPTTATLAWNVYRGNKAGDSGGGFFCDNGATCIASHEVYDRNCGGNVLLDGGSEGSAATRATFDHVTNVGALDVGCSAPGTGVFVDTNDGFAADTYSVTNSIFWGNAPEKDFATSCAKGCAAIKVSVSSSLMQLKYAKDGGITIEFGRGMIESVDPQFVAADKGDFRLKPGSPAAGKASDGTDLGAFGGKGAAPPDAGAAVEEAVEEPPPVETPAAAEQPAAPPPEAREPPDVAPSEAGAAAVPGEAGDESAKEAFEAARSLGTVEAWNAFLESYKSGFYANLARAYLKKLGATARD